MAQAYIPAHGGPSVAVSHLGSEATAAMQAPGPVGTDSDANELEFPFIQVIAVNFESAHKKRMTDKDYFGPGGTPEGKKVSFESGGTPFAKDFAWKGDPATGKTDTHPVSHTGDQKVTLKVTVRLEGHSGSVKGTLVGRAGGTGVAKGMKFVAYSQTFHPGDKNVVTVESNKRLSKQIQKVQFNVSWQVFGPLLAAYVSPRLVLAQSVQSRNELFVTMGEPQFEDKLEITYGRMAHAVEKAAAAMGTDAHQIVESIVKSVGFGDSSGGTWLLARNPGSSADCITISKYVEAIVKLVGLQGTAKAVIVYVRPKGPIQWKWLIPKRPGIERGFPAPAAVEQARLIDDVKAGDFKVVEDPDPPDPAKAGLNWPLIVHPGELWFLRLISDEEGREGKNNYEGCVKFTDDQGVTKWYPAGTQLGGLDKEKVIPKVFKSLSWVSNDDQIKEAVEDY